MTFVSKVNAVPWDKDYQALLVEKLSQRTAELSSYPSTKYPNRNIEKILKKYPEKIPIFGYGSLMNPQSAGRSVSREAVYSMRPVAAFGLKRIFNYNAGHVTRWGELKDNEKAMLNVEPTATYNSVINGVVMEVSPEDFIQLIEREKGYDLAPILVVDWNDIATRNPSPHIQVAYTFFVPYELRQGMNYIQTKYYPVRGYLHAVQDGAAVYGQDFLSFWNTSTYMGDGTTPIDHWDQKTFSGILDTNEP